MAKAEKDIVRKAQLKKLENIAAFLPLCMALAFCAFLWTRFGIIRKAEAAPLSSEQSEALERTLDALFPERTETIRALPYRFEYEMPAINAAAAILINAKSGEILFEKNADKEIPPASMTKLFLIYSVMQKVRAGEVSLDQVIPIDERALAHNMPSESSVMLLGRGQIVTLGELLQGVSVASGNDASYAIAFALYGSMENFISEINSIIKSLGLSHTRIVESSGYSELNMTTAREMASFCKTYLDEFPDSLELFHSMKEFTYPKEKNLPAEQRGRAAQILKEPYPEEIWTSVDFTNTNKLLGSLEGCDGIKTGHIHESGYNLALTTKRGSVRYISVTMGGPGNGLIEGDRYRSADGRALQESAYANFSEVDAPSSDETEFSLPLFGAEENAVRVRAAWKRPAAVPKTSGRKVRIEADLPQYLFGGIKAGETVGFVKWILCDEYGEYGGDDDEKVIQEIPLVAAKSVRQGNSFLQSSDNIIIGLSGLRKLPRQKLLIKTVDF